MIQLFFANQTKRQHEKWGAVIIPCNNDILTYSGNPVLPLGNEGEWDDFGHYHPCLLFDAGVLKMWYASSDGNTVAIGYAESDCAPRVSGRNWPPVSNRD